MYIGLHHIQLGMPQGQESVAREFYVGVLDLVEIAKPSGLTGRGGVWFRSGALELHLGVQVPFRPAVKGHPGIAVTDLDDVIRQLQTGDREIVHDSEFPGFRRVYTADCFGNRLEFLQKCRTEHLPAEPVGTAQRVSKSL